MTSILLSSAASRRKSENYIFWKNDKNNSQDLRNTVRQAHHERLMILAFHSPFALSVSKGELFCVSPDS